jgi:hypothetical protein
MHSKCHDTVNINEVTLVNNGFPINFNGSLNSVSPKLIQLTRAMIISAIQQSLSISGKGIINLDIKLQDLLLSNFRKIVNLDQIIERK